jgi:hypothetical protein
MNVPIKTFWLMNYNIGRILALKDMRSLTVAVCGQSGEAASDHRQQLVIEAGTAVKLKIDPIAEAKRDEIGFQALKEMAQQM